MTDHVQSVTVYQSFFNLEKWAIFLHGKSTHSSGLIVKTQLLFNYSDQSTDNAIEKL